MMNENFPNLWVDFYDVINQDGFRRRCQLSGLKQFL